MPGTDAARVAPLLRRLTSIAPLDAADLDALAALPFTTQTFAPQQDIVRFGEMATQCGVVLDGWVCRNHVLRGGERQIVNVYIAGDLPDIEGLALRVMDYNLSALTQTTIAFISHEAIRDVVASHPGIAKALWRASLIDAASDRERITSLGRRPALARIAHLFCELYLRLRVVGLADGLTFALPVRQVDISDMLGLTSVHVSRTLQEIRQRSLASVSRRRLVINNWNGLVRAAEFDPTYLHLDRAALR